LAGRAGALRSAVPRVGSTNSVRSATFYPVVVLLVQGVITMSQPIITEPPPQGISNARCLFKIHSFTVYKNVQMVSAETEAEAIEIASGTQNKGKVIGQTHVASVTHPRRGTCHAGQ